MQSRAYWNSWHRNKALRRGKKRKYGGAYGSRRATGRLFEEAFEAQFDRQKWLIKAEEGQSAGVSTKTRDNPRRFTPETVAEAVRRWNVRALPPSDCTDLVPLHPSLITTEVPEIPWASIE